MVADRYGVRLDWTGEHETMEYIAAMRRTLLYVKCLALPLVIGGPSIGEV